MRLSASGMQCDKALWSCGVARPTHTSACSAPPYASQAFGGRPRFALTGCFFGVSSASEDFFVVFVAHGFIIAIQLPRALPRHLSCRAPCGDIFNVTSTLRSGLGFCGLRESAASARRYFNSACLGRLEDPFRHEFEVVAFSRCNEFSVCFVENDEALIFFVRMSLYLCVD